MRTIGLFLIAAAVTIVIYVFGPLAGQEIGYYANQWGRIQYTLEVSDYTSAGLRPIVPVSTDFGIVIPKINANAAIFAEVDPANPQNYLPVLKKGVACVSGSVLPGRWGNVFLFAHASDAFFGITHYNMIFFLAGKLEMGDEIDLFYLGKRYQYEVFEKGVVTPGGVDSYIKEHVSGQAMSLETGYPAGTIMARLVILARQKGSK